MVGPLTRLVTYRAWVRLTETPNAATLLFTWFGGSLLRFVDLSASGQHKTSYQHHAGPCCGMYCSTRRFNALLNLPCIWVTVHLVFNLFSWFWDQVNLSFLLMRALNFISIGCFLLGALFTMFLSVFQKNEMYFKRLYGSDKNFQNTMTQNVTIKYEFFCPLPPPPSAEGYEKKYISWQHWINFRNSKS